MQEEFEDTKGAIRNRTSKKNRQHNDKYSKLDKNCIIISNFLMLLNWIYPIRRLVIFHDGVKYTIKKPNGYQEGIHQRHRQHREQVNERKKNPQKTKKLSDMDSVIILG